MKGFINTYKEISETPFEVVKKFKEQCRVNDKVAYAGRLDPMASGVLILLIGETCKERKYYQNLPKVYEYKVLLGISTDSLDQLGLIVSKQEKRKTFNATSISRVLENLEGDLELKYPLYCSYTIDGEPMFILARKAKINDLDRPSRNVFISKNELLDIKSEKIHELSSQFVENVSTVNGDFRQKEISKQWSQLKLNDFYQVVNVRSEVSSGTYIRSLGELLGKKLGVPALVYDIKRVSVDKFSIEDSLKI